MTSSPGKPRKRTIRYYPLRICLISFIAISVCGLLLLISQFLLHKLTPRAKHEQPAYVDVLAQPYLRQTLQVLQQAHTAGHWAQAQRALRAVILADASRCSGDAALASQWEAMQRSEMLPTQTAVFELYETLMQVVTTEGPGLCRRAPQGSYRSHWVPVQRLLIASNLRDAQQLMPHMLRQLLLGITALRPGVEVAVSVYESGSKDATGLWLQTLHLFLELLGVPNRIIVDGRLVRQILSKGKLEDRIHFLAKIRNRLLQPLFGKDPEPALPGSSKLLVDSDGRPLLPVQPSLGPAPFKAQKVLFVNDVYACGWQMIRLLQHEADMVCGFDFWRSSYWQHAADTEAPHRVRHPEDTGVPRDLRGQRSRALLGVRARVLQERMDAALLRSTARAQVMRKQRGEAFKFYDTWVARDDRGARFHQHAPYLRSASQYVRQRLAEGQAAPVSCCWNGMAAVSAQVFFDGIKFRSVSNSSKECRASECSLLCDDMARAGFTRVAVDPSVRVAYRLMEAQDVYTHYVQQLPWVNLTALTLPEPVDWAKVPRPSQRECCSLAEDKDHVDFHRCAMVPFPSTKQRNLLTDHEEDEAAAEDEESGRESHHD